MTAPRRQFTETLDVLAEYAAHRGHRFLRLDGSTNRIVRELDVRAFNAPGSDTFLYLISTRAGGQGINLHTADTVVLYDSCYNPQIDLQARHPPFGGRPAAGLRPVRIAAGLLSCPTCLCVEVQGFSPYYREWAVG